MYIPLKEFGTRHCTVDAKSMLTAPELDIKVAIIGSMTGAVTFSFPKQPEQGTHVELMFGPGAFELDPAQPMGFGLWPKVGL